MLVLLNVYAYILHEIANAAFWTGSSFFGSLVILDWLCRCLSLFLLYINKK